MQARGWFTPLAVGLVLLIAGFAFLDTIRSCGTTTTTRRVAPTTEATTTEPEPTTTDENGPQPQEDAPADWPQGELDGVLTFVGSDDCRIRTIGLSSGRERPPSQFFTDCRGFWAPKVGSRVAFGVVLGEGFFQIRDLGHPRRDFGSYPIGADTQPIWSPDGQHIAWCDSPNTGVEREILGQGRVLPFCPVAYTLDGRLARAGSKGLAVGATTVAVAPTPVTWAQFGAGGSILIESEGALERFVGGMSVGSVDLPANWTGGPPVGSPDTCYVAIPTEVGYRVEPLCTDGPFLESPAQAVAWSPDGRWLAMAMENSLAFVSVGRAFSGFTTWPAQAVQLQWRTG